MGSKCKGVGPGTYHKEKSKQFVCPSQFRANQKKWPIFHCNITLQSLVSKYHSCYLDPQGNTFL